MTEQKTCSDRIAGEWNDRRQDFERLVTAIQNDDEDIREEAYQEANEYPLAISKRVQIRVELSYGGPQDYLTYSVVPEDGSVEGITYHFLDWFDGATLPLEGDDFAAAESYLESIMDVQSFIAEQS